VETRNSQGCIIRARKRRRWRVDGTVDLWGENRRQWEICRRKKLSRNLRRFWDSETLRWMILPMQNSFRLFAMANRFHAKSRFRFITNREGEPAASGNRAGRNAGERFFSNGDPLTCARDLIGCEANLEFVRWDSRLNGSVQCNRR